MLVGRSNNVNNINQSVERLRLLTALVETRSIK